MNNKKIYFMDNEFDPSICQGFIYNRFDLFIPPIKYVVGCIEEDNRKRFFQVDIDGKIAALGIWLVPVSEDELKDIKDLIFSKYPNVNKIVYENALVPFDIYREKNHFQILLPESSEDLAMRLSSKGRYNIKREFRLLSELGDLHIENYSSDAVSEELMEKYFQLKKATHQRDYGISGKDYIDKYHVTDIYVMYLDDAVLAMILSCEQCPIVYVENLTYDVKYAKYSPGQVLYDHYLKKLIEKGTKELYLAGGNFDYKKRYGSIEKTVYDGIIYRNSRSRTIEMAKRQIKKCFKTILRRG